MGILLGRAWGTAAATSGRRKFPSPQPGLVGHGPVFLLLRRARVCLQRALRPAGSGQERAEQEGP